MTDEPTATVTLKALQFHSYHGVEHQVDDTYEAEVQDVDNIEAQGKARRAAPAPAPEPAA